MGRKEGVINLKDKQKIILEAILKGKTQRQIARDMKMSRTTVAKYIKKKGGQWIIQNQDRTK